MSHLQGVNLKCLINKGSKYKKMSHLAFRRGIIKIVLLKRGKNKMSNLEGVKVDFDRLAF